MEVIPAIDLVDGQCVRLMQGDYSKKTVYSDDPVEVALRWESLGATRIHIVDLDGARLGKPANLGVIGRIASSVGVPIQMGGGVRSLEAARTVIGAGVQRVMLGTVAVRDPEHRCVGALWSLATRRSWSRWTRAMATSRYQVGPPSSRSSRD